MSHFFLPVFERKATAHVCFKLFPTFVSLHTHTLGKQTCLYSPFKLPTAHKPGGFAMLNQILEI